MKLEPVVFFPFVVFPTFPFFFTSERCGAVTGEVGLYQLVGVVRWRWGAGKFAELDL